MKRRLSGQELALILVPFPLLWLVLGFTVHPAVFRFWVPGQSIAPLRAMELGFIPIGFTVLYLLFVFACRGTFGKIGWSTVGICASMAYAVSYALCPLP